MTQQAFVGLCLGGAGVAVILAALSAAVALLWCKLARLSGTPLLDYELNPVLPEAEEAYRRLHPQAVCFDAFCKAFLENRRWEAWHGRLRADRARQAARFAGLKLYVRVKSLP